MSESNESDDWLAGGEIGAELAQGTLVGDVDIDTSDLPEPPDDPEVA
jgi:hypothetical protein